MAIRLLVIKSIIERETAQTTSLRSQKFLFKVEKDVELPGEPTRKVGLRNQPIPFKRKGRKPSLQPGPNPNFCPRKKYNRGLKIKDHPEAWLRPWNR